jgi:hypothetical protein
MSTAVVTGIALGFEIMKWLNEERRIREKMKAAGMSPESIEATFQESRKELAALPSASTLPEV